MEQIILILERVENGEKIPKLETKSEEKFAPVNGQIAILRVFGVISRRANMFSDCSGGTSLEQLSAKFDELVQNPGVESIILLIDSPGGSVAGLSEFADKVYKARKNKQVIAMVDTLAASAAYWIASACESIVLTPSGQVGSIGCIAVHEDESAAIEQMGVKTTIVQAGQYKSEWSSLQPLTKEGRDYLQYQVDYYYGEFVDAVAKNRGTTSNNVTKKYGQGRVLVSQDALSAGMVDRVETFENVLKELLAKSSARQKRINSYTERKAALSAMKNHIGVNT